MHYTTITKIMEGKSIGTDGGQMWGKEFWAQFGAAKAKLFMSTACASHVLSKSHDGNTKKSRSNATNNKNTPGVNINLRLLSNRLYTSAVLLH